MNNDNNGYEENGVVSDFVKFNKVDDYVQGVWVDAFTPDKPDRFGKIERKLSIKATAGLWHDTDGSKVEAEVGSVYRISEKSAIAAQLKKTPMGAYVMFKLTELKKTDKSNPAKIITVYTKKDAEGRPVVDTEYKNSTQSQSVDAEYEDNDVDVDEVAKTF